MSHFGEDAVSAVSAGIRTGFTLVVVVLVLAVGGCTAALGHAFLASMAERKEPA